MRAYSASSNPKSPRLINRVESAYSTRRSLRLVASLPPPARIPLTPIMSSLSQTLSSLRLNLVNDQPSRAAAFAERQGRPLYLLWLDAHSDFHTPLTTTSGNLHGTPLAYIAGRDGFDAFPPFPAPVPVHRICMFGIRSVDPAEQAAMQECDIAINDMRVIDERGIVAPLREFLTRCRDEGGMLHVSLDVDFLDPSIAPAVGTTVPGGATFREAHLVMELLHESGLVTSLDLVELNPFLDDRGMTARLMVDLVGSLMGKKVFDRPTRAK